MISYIIIQFYLKFVWIVDWRSTVVRAYVVRHSHRHSHRHSRHRHSIAIGIGIAIAIAQTVYRCQVRPDDGCCLGPIPILIGLDALVLALRAGRRRPPAGDLAVIDR